LKYGGQKQSHVHTFVEHVDMHHNFTRLAWRGFVPSFGHDPIVFADNGAFLVAKLHPCSLPSCRPADHDPTSLADSGYIHAADHNPIVFADNDILTS